MSNIKWIKYKKYIGLILGMTLIGTFIYLGNSKDTKQQVNIPNITYNNNEENEISLEIKTISDLKKRFNYDNNILAPIYNVSQEGEFKLNFETNSTLPDDAIGVYTNKDCNIESLLDTVKEIEKNKEGQTVEIKPYKQVLSDSTDTGWGKAPIYYIKISYDISSDDLRLLDKPIIIPFRTENIVESPILRYDISENGIFKLTWNKISNATGYRIYKTELGYKNNESSASIGYKNSIPKLITEVTSDVTEWNDWINNGTNGLGSVNGEANIYQNFGLSGEYYITTVIDDKESKYSNSILVSDYADILPVKISDNILSPGDYIDNVRDLPRSINVNTLNNDTIKYNVNYNIDETTRFQDNVYYNYSVKGTELKGYIEIKAGDVTNLPKEIKNGIETYEDSYNINFKTIQSKVKQDSIINLNTWIDNCVNIENQYNTMELHKIDNLTDLNEINDSLEYYLTYELLNYSKKIDLNAFQSRLDYIALEDMVLKICYQNPLIYGIKQISYNENTNELIVVYSEDTNNLLEKRDLIYNKILAKIPLIIRRNTKEDIVEDIYKYINDSFIYNKDGNLYELITNNNGNALAYSQLFKMICDEFKIDCKIVSGSLNGNLHTWNCVNYDTNNNAWYYIDVTNNLKNIGMQRMCYNMSSDYAKNIGYLSNSLYELDNCIDQYKSNNDAYEYYKVNNLVANNSEDYFSKVKELVEKDTKVITVRYTGDEIGSSEIINNISLIFKNANKELELGKLRFGDGLGYYVLWFEN